MIPRTVQMAKEVETQLTTQQYLDYGNIILNGYLSVEPNTAGRKAWQYAETTTAPVDLPSVTTVRPALKGWTNNYQEYFTGLTPVAPYGQYPGMPTMFEYTVHSFTLALGTISGLGTRRDGVGYTTGTYTNVATVGGRGTGATLNITVDALGLVTAATINNAGTGYAVGDGLTAASGTIGAGTGVSVPVATIVTVSPAGISRWAQPPHRFYQNGAAAFIPPFNNPQATQYSFIYPVGDSTVAPPIDIILN